jgi:hypothetical protein
MYAALIELRSGAGFRIGRERAPGMTPAPLRDGAGDCEMSVSQSELP